jgi:hypothetical protein
MAIAKKTTKKTTKSQDNDLDALLADAGKKASNAAKAKAKAKTDTIAKVDAVGRASPLAGKTLEPTEAGLACRGGTVRAQVTTAFKGGVAYEDGLASLAKLAPPRGVANDHYAQAKVAAAIRKGLLKIA